VRQRFKANIHGHIHAKPVFDRTLYYNVSLENINMTPKPWDEIKEEIEFAKAEDTCYLT